MFVKRAYLAGEYDGEPLVHLIKPGEMVKTSGLAPASSAFLATLKPDPNYTYVLVNAMGYSEFFGSNSNADWYGHNEHLDFNGLLHAWPDIGQNVVKDRMLGKDWPYGYPCFYNSTVFAHHKNNDPQQLGFGDVIFACINPEMKRVELVKRVFNNEAMKKGHSSILDRIRAGERCDVSMGCKVPFDLCSICTDWPEVKKAWGTYDPTKFKHPGVAILAYHKTVKPIRGLAVTKVDYCEHMITEKGKTFRDGRKVFVYNDFPRFFDISFVWIGADRTARVMFFMGDTRPRSDYSDTERRLMTLAKQRPERVATMPQDLQDMIGRLFGKTASMDKEIPGGMAEAALRDADTAPELDVHILVQGKPSVPEVRKVLSTLASLGIIPTPTEFQNLVAPTMDPFLKSSMRALGATFDTRSNEIDDTYAVDPTMVDDKLAFAAEPMMAERSSFAPFLNARLAEPSEKRASSRREAIKLSRLAAAYNGFRLSVLEQAPRLFAKSASHLPLGALLDSQDGRIEQDLGGLLLGPGTVVQLISSHLHRLDSEGQQIGTMVGKIASTKFHAMSAIGSALRHTMGLDKTSGMTQAASTFASGVREAM